MYFLLIVASLFFSVKGGNFIAVIEKFEIKPPYDENLITYCDRSNISICIDQVEMCFQRNCDILNNGKFSKDLILIYGDNITISLNVTLKDIANYSLVQFDPIELNWTNFKSFNLKNLNNSLSLNLSLKCHKDFLLPKCSEIDLCRKLPTTICKNKGSCSQNNATISCKCPENYTGEFCEDQKNPCKNNSCMNNSTCQKNDNMNLKYECICLGNFQGKFCHEDSNECLNESICSHLPNSTCSNFYGGYNCLCDKSCQMTTFTTSSSVQISTSQAINFIKWNLPDLATLLIVTIEAAIIIILVLVLIFVQIKNCPRKKKKSKFLVDDSFLFIKSKEKKPNFDFNYERPQLIPDDRHQSLVPMYDIQELENTFNNNLSNNSPGMSTFGRR